MPRRLRITASLFFAVVTVAICVLWVRSYWRADSVFKFYAKGFSGVSTFRGEIGLHSVWDQFSMPLSGWDFRSRPIDENAEFPLVMSDGTPIPARFGIRFRPAVNATIVFVPIRFLLVASALLAAAPWFRPSSRFSLRTLLIATTLVAVVLGLGIWAAG